MQRKSGLRDKSPVTAGQQQQYSRMNEPWSCRNIVNSPRQFGPLDRFPAVRTSNVEEWERLLIEVLGARRLEVVDGKNLPTYGNYVQLGGIALGYSDIQSRAIVSYNEAPSARLKIVSRGQVVSKVGASIEAAHPGHSSVASPNQTITSEYDGYLQMLFLRIDVETLHRNIASLTGVHPRAHLILNPTQFTSPQLIGGLKAMVNGLVTLLDTEHLQIAPTALKEYEQAIVLQFLHACQHNYSHLLLQGADRWIPHHVRKIAEYIDANWRDAITINNLVEISGVNASVIFRSFAKVHGETPMAFVKRRRLEEARKMLTDPSREISVTEAACACAFSNTGHFAGYYRAQFGERPSETLMRTRRLR